MTPVFEGLTSVASGNRSQYALWIQGLDHERLSVLGFEAEGYGLSEEYRFEVRFEAGTALALSEVLGTRVRLDLATGVEACPVHGTITALQALEGGIDGVRHALTLCSPLAPLAESAHTRAFVEKSVPEILEEVLKAHDWTSDAWRLELKDAYPALELTVQSGEDDLHFMRRLMARHGLYYRFEQTPEQAVLVIHDSVEALPDAPVGALEYIPLKGENRSFEAVHRLEVQSRLLSQSVTLRDYNPDTPDVALVGEGSNDCDVPGTGACRHWGEQLRDPDGAERLARIRAEALDCRRRRIIIHTDHRGLAPGMGLDITGHPRGEYNIRYTVVAMTISADQSAARADGGDVVGPTFEAVVELIPASQCFRAELLDAPNLGRVSARIESQGGDYAHLDEQGRYRLRFDFDERDSNPAEASHAVRMVSPFAGDGYGFHFPLLEGTEVVVGFENNDPDRPLITGALHNHAQPSPVNAANASQNVLRTPAGNELIMDDSRGAERISLSTPDAQLSLTLDATEGEHKAALRTELGDMAWYAGEGLTLECGADQTVVVGADQEVTVEQSQKLVTKHGGIEMQAGSDIRLTAREVLRLESESADIEQYSERDTAIEAGRHLRMNARGGNFDCRVDEGEARLRAGGEIQLLSTQGDVRIGTASTGVSISASGDIAIKAGRITIEAANVNIKGGNIGNN
jgi:type VI secretion system secreted protein VgrG